MEQMQAPDAAQQSAESQAIQAAQAAQAAAQAAGQAAAQAAQAAQAAGLAAQQAQGMAAAQAASADQSGMAGQGIPDGTDPKFDQNKFGEILGKVNAVIAGEAPPESLLSSLTDTGGDFWKGAIVGAAAVFLVNNETVKETVSGLLGSVFGGKEGTSVQVSEKE